MRAWDTVKLSHQSSSVNFSHQSIQRSSSSPNPAACIVTAPAIRFKKLLREALMVLESEPAFPPYRVTTPSPQRPKAQSSQPICVCNPVLGSKASRANLPSLQTQTPAHTAQGPAASRSVQPGSEECACNAAHARSMKTKHSKGSQYPSWCTVQNAVCA